MWEDPVNNRHVNEQIWITLITATNKKPEACGRRKRWRKQNWRCVKQFVHHCTLKTDNTIQWMGIYGKNPILNERECISNAHRKKHNFFKLQNLTFIVILLQPWGTMNVAIFRVHSRSVGAVTWCMPAGWLHVISYQQNWYNYNIRY